MQRISALFAALLAGLALLAPGPLHAEPDRPETVHIVLDPKLASLQRLRGLVLLHGLLYRDANVALSAPTREGLKQLDLTRLEELGTAPPQTGEDDDRDELSARERSEQLTSALESVVDRLDREIDPLRRTRLDLSSVFDALGRRGPTDARTIFLLAGGRRGLSGELGLEERVLELRRAGHSPVFLTVGEGPLQNDLAASDVPHERAELVSPREMLKLLGTVPGAVYRSGVQAQDSEVLEGGRALMGMLGGTGEAVSIPPSLLLGPNEYEIEFLAPGDTVRWFRLPGLAAALVSEPNPGKWWFFQPDTEEDSGPERFWLAEYPVQVQILREYQPVKGREWPVRVRVNTPNEIVARRLRENSEVRLILRDAGERIVTVQPEGIEDGVFEFRFDLPEREYERAELIAEFAGEHYLLREHLGFRPVPPPRFNLNLSPVAVLGGDGRARFELRIASGYDSERGLRITPPEGFSVSPETVDAPPGKTTHELELTPESVPLNFLGRERTLDIGISSPRGQNWTRQIDYRSPSLVRRYPLYSGVAGGIGLLVFIFLIGWLNRMRRERHMLQGELVLPRQDSGEPRRLDLLDYRERTLTVGNGPEVDVPVPVWEKMADGVVFVLERTGPETQKLISHSWDLQVDGELLKEGEGVELKGKHTLSLGGEAIEISLR